jgi:hypothetical protein
VSKLNHVNRSARRTSARSLSPSTNRAAGSSPAAHSLKNNNLLKTITIVKKRKKIWITYFGIHRGCIGSNVRVVRQRIVPSGRREQPTRTSGAAGSPPRRTTPAVRSPAVRP